ncbi:MAG: tRNA pseudouridine(55) synthase TruB [Bacteroidales bacterium]|nr:tRNA pseudouridine(55) synthase TruB [Bacteroidales bacterium]
MQIPENNFHFEEGELLLIDKPVGWTSFDVVNHIRVALKRYLNIPKLKVGHAGTLDPLASGLLILCTGPMTKQIQNFQDQDKTYTGTMQLGLTTPSYDLETAPDATFPFDDISAEQLEQARIKFLGTIEQLPPVYSAVKIDGKRAFKYARKSQDVVMKTRVVEINKFLLTSIELPFIKFEISCSKGTYIRSLVSDFGKALDNGACLTELRRTRIGDFSIENAWELTALKAVITGVETGKTDVENKISVFK